MLPSRSANSIHVVHQCQGLVNAGVDVSLYAKRSIKDESLLPQNIEKNYGISTKNISLVTYFSGITKADTLRIAWLSYKKIRGEEKPIILSRNLYASYILGVLNKRPLLFETHQLEFGFRKRIQQAIISRPWIRTIVISEKLAELLGEHHKKSLINPLVLHDAAPENIKPLPDSERYSVITNDLKEDISSWQAICGYFGHLYRGRGIEIIEALASRHPGCLFLVYGGNDQEVQRYRNENNKSNLRYRGYVPHPVAKKIMLSSDFLLMPYQENVSISHNHKHDTARWMSPMKMFEYMATGRPVISSDLPVLREVLSNEYNSLLVKADDITSWSSAIRKLLENKELAARIGKQAHLDYLNKYTWRKRAEEILQASATL